MQKGKLNIVIGGQAGSESKGKFASYLVKKYEPDIICMSSSPNAGHTAYVDGRKYVTYHLPVSAMGNDTTILLGPTSVINMRTFIKEIIDNDVDPRRIVIDSRASFIEESDCEGERKCGLLSIGSTNQGVGEARVRRLRRDKTVPRFADTVFANDLSNGYYTPWPSFNVADSVSDLLNNYLDGGCVVLAEATQGFDLDLEHGISPRHCTSKMINTAMVMAELGVPPQRVGSVYGVVRPYPIRVNNREGNSGSYAGAEEITWEEVGKRCGHTNPEEILEMTTTTKLPRRVFEFSKKRFQKFCTVCGPTQIALQFANYLDWYVYGWTGDIGKKLPEVILDQIRLLERISGVPVTYVGTGPGEDEYVELLDDEDRIRVTMGKQEAVPSSAGSNDWVEPACDDDQQTIPPGDRVKPPTIPPSELSKYKPLPSP